LPATSTPNKHGQKSQEVSLHSGCQPLLEGCYTRRCNEDVGLSSNTRSNSGSSNLSLLFGVGTLHTQSTTENDNFSCKGHGEQRPKKVTPIKRS
jgi:hypothetical protein